MRRLATFAAVMVLVGGCAALKQAREDYNTGKVTQLAANETAPKEAAKNLVEPVAPLIPEPFRSPASGALIGLLTAVGTWQRGRRIRKGKPASVNPITGPWGDKLGLEFLVQNAANVIRGASELGKDGSGFQRAWKVGLSVVGGGAIVAMQVPAVKDFIVSNPGAFAEFGAVVAALAGIEKELSKVLVVEKPATPAGN